MKFRKRPVVINAWNLAEMLHSNPALLPQPIGKAIASGAFTLSPDGTATIKTLEGDHLASKGDWIIQGVQGELYPCKPDIFVATYEPVEG
jgi:hypothetical protein